MDGLCAVALGRPIKSQNPGSESHGFEITEFEQHVDRKPYKRFSRMQADEETREEKERWTRLHNCTLA